MGIPKEGVMPVTPTFSVVYNILSIASVDYCLHIYNTIKTLFCQ